jgi:hypothetical protein
MSEDEVLRNREDILRVFQAAIAGEGMPKGQTANVVYVRWKIETLESGDEESIKREAGDIWHLYECYLRIMQGVRPGGAVIDHPV